MKNVKIAEKYGEGYLTLSYHPEKVSAHTLLYFLLVYFFFPIAYILVHALLNGPERGPSWKRCKEMSQSIMGHEQSFLQPQKNGLWWKYF